MTLVILLEESPGRFHESNRLNDFISDFDLVEFLGGFGEVRVFVLDHESSELDVAGVRVDASAATAEDVVDIGVFDEAAVAWGEVLDEGAAIVAFAAL